MIDKNKLQSFFEENFSNDCGYILVSNIIQYLELQDMDNETAIKTLMFLLDGTGITEQEIKDCLDDQLYYVSIAVDSRVDIPVRASSYDEARLLAENKFAFMELAEQEVIDYHAVNATDENDNMIDF